MLYAFYFTNLHFLSDFLKNIYKKDLAYNYDVNRASNFVYDDYEEDVIEAEESADNSVKSLNSLSKIAETQTL